jgi:hemolysin activation/secretion protein
MIFFIHLLIPPFGINVLKRRLSSGIICHVLSNLQLAPFLDLGQVWNNNTNPNGPIRQGLLAGGGLGILWQPTRHLDLRVDYAVPFVSLENRGGGLQDNGVYFSVVVRP